MENRRPLCGIEQHAILFALLAKHAILLCGEDGKEAIIAGVTRYGEERGARMARRAQDNGDALDLVADQAYGEWVPGPEDQMETGVICTEPTYQTYTSICPWCDAWKKHGLLDFGKYYCLTVDEAVYHGFREDFHVNVKSNVSWGAERCVFDWNQPMTEEDVTRLVEKKKALGNSCVRDFDYHTAHLLSSVGDVLRERLEQRGEEAVQKAVEDFVTMFGQPYLDALVDIYP